MLHIYASIWYNYSIYLGAFQTGFEIRPRCGPGVFRQTELLLAWEGIGMIRAGIIGASGYAGGELARILANHPDVEIAFVSTRTYVGQRISDVFSSLRKVVDIVFENLEPAEAAVRADVIFTAVPHGAAMDIAPAVREAGGKMIDLGADYRFDDPDLYSSWYKIGHKTPELLRESVYGLPEVNREKIKGAWLVGNPGCYPTATILGIMPLLKEGLVDPGTIIVDAKSGVSGAGRNPDAMYHFPECNDNLRAYGVAGHRHTPEIEQEMGKLAGEPVKITFTPHLIPMTRGILSTIYSTLVKGRSTSELLNLYREFYEGEPFVRVLPEGELPQTKATYGSNFCDISLKVDERTGRVIVLSAIDNLVKGASGQAVQNMNILFGLKETTGLMAAPVFP